ncbi:hypothetical protein [uncultured Kushneria sp.]|uniref:hypothetical protein n=1 Tax=uncultured Kushneria sp. TaxID=905033 RepID=UPI002621E774|nr:hypothetical protein [uncultured Kushneria sp.]
MPMHVTTHSSLSGATHVTLRDESGRGVDAINMSPFVFELYLAYRETMSDAEAFVLVRDGSEEEQAA